MDREERRRHPRVPYGAWVEIEDDEQGLAFYLAENLSLGGMMLASNREPPALGNRVRLRLVIENETRVMTVQGVVIRHASEKEGGFGVKFDALDGPRETFLTELVEELADPE